MLPELIDINTPNDERIERRTESYMNSADALLMANKITQSEYDAWTHRLDKWAERQYSRLPRKQ